MLVGVHVETCDRWEGVVTAQAEAHDCREVWCDGSISLSLMPPGGVVVPVGKCAEACDHRDSVVTVQAEACDRREVWCQWEFMPTCATVGKVW